MSVWKRRGSQALRIVCAVYLVAVVLDGSGCELPTQMLPRPFVFFTQVSVLFPKAAHATIDYRAEALSCSKKDWVELDIRPYFPIDPDDKENRFNRAMHFYREDHKAMHALDQYVTRRYEKAGEGEAIGGVRFLSLRIPIPPVGSDFERYTRYPLAHYPESERHYFYHTPESARDRRCGGRGEE